MSRAWDKEKKKFEKNLRVLARLASFAQIGELARRLMTCQIFFFVPRS